MSFASLVLETRDFKRSIACRHYSCTRETVDTLAVIAHPYKPLGGSQADPVVCHIARTFQSHAIPAFTFDFGSPTSWRGVRESNDYLQVAKHALVEAYPEVQVIYCCGYSYGTLCLPKREEITRVVGRVIEVRYLLISPLLPPISNFLTMSLRDPYHHVKRHRHMAVWGTRDNFTSASRLAEAWVAGCSVPGADHFWRSREDMTSLERHATRFINATP